VQAQTIYDEMKRLRKLYPNIPLYAVVEDICASGGYFIAAGADQIYVGKASIVGSIGVLMNGFGFTGLMDKLGVERRLITAGENKGMLDPFSPVDPKDVRAREDADQGRAPAVHRRGEGGARQAAEGDAGHVQRADLDRREERRARPRRRLSAASSPWRAT
jgi:protease-4